MKTSTAENNYYPTDLNVGDLIVWHIPQIPMKPFRAKVDSWAEGEALIDLLAHYDLFQYEQNLKGDYSNTSGMQVYGGQKYINESRKCMDPRDYSFIPLFSDSDAFFDAKTEENYLDQLEYLKSI